MEVKTVPEDELEAVVGRHIDAEDDEALYLVSDVAEVINSMNHDGDINWNVDQSISSEDSSAFELASIVQIDDIKLILSVDTEETMEPALSFDDVVTVIGELQDTVVDQFLKLRTALLED